MTAAVALNGAIESRWTVVNGENKGTFYTLNSAAFTIGRNSDCEIVIVNDPKCSRRHATARWVGKTFEITSLNTDNPVLVNGSPLTTGMLQDGDVVTAGDTDLRVNWAKPAGQAPALKKQKRPKPASAKKKSSPVLLAVYFLLGLFVLFLVMQGPVKKKDEVALRTQKQIDADIEAANKLHEAALKPLSKMDDSLTARQAQENYVRGFRDYRRGQFERSLESFQACLALDPVHVLCNRYIHLAQRRFSEIVQINMVLGRKNKERGQYNSCKAAFRNVMVMVKDTNSVIYKEAKANYDACTALVEGRY